MKVNIKNLSISGLRGIRQHLLLNLNESSVLLFGENGSGKSSISDCLEWFYKDCVSHLSSSEIDMREAIRNSYIEKENISTSTIAFNFSKFDATKKMFYKKEKLVCEFDNNSPEFKNYLEKSEKENLVLRYQALRDFVDVSKGEKLNYLSEIIGFDEVTRTKDILKKAVNSAKSEVKTQNFETQINTQKQILINKIGAAVSRPEDFIQRLNEIIRPLKLGLEIKALPDIDTVLIKLKSNSNTPLLNELNFLERCNNVLANLKNEIEFINTEYEKYFKEFKKIEDDVKSIWQTFLLEFLQVGDEALHKFHKEDSCPFCLQPKNRESLIKEIQTRIKNIGESTKKRALYELAKTTIINIIKERIKRIETIQQETLLSEEPNKFIKAVFEALHTDLENYQVNAIEKVTSGKGIKQPEELKISNDNFGEMSQMAERIEILKKIISQDNKTDIYSNISAAKDAFSLIKVFEKRNEFLQKQKLDLEIVYNEFIKKQKEGLELFINSFSDQINEFYQYMNPGEQFHDLRIVTIGEEDELNGITIEYRYNNQWISPPQKYFSESHMNCFGISFFLASVLAFNRCNNFLVLDDVISSFDSNHRKKFADLIFTKFKDWQIILLTHEHEWFKYVQPLAKKNGWLINEIKWSDTKGTYLDEKLIELKELISNCIAESNVEVVGNLLRKYLEGLLKEICHNLEVKVSFQYNETNEKRMPDELINALRSKINKSSSELKAKMIVIDNVANSNILGNLLSHNNSFNPSIGDIKAFWKDILELESIFYCQEITCKKPTVSIKNYDTVGKKIRCGCDKTKYDWKL